MSRSPQEKYVLLFEAMKRSLLAADILLQRLVSEVSALERDIERHVDIEGRAAFPLLNAVAFVDFAHRFGSIVDSLPLINKRAPEIRRLRVALSEIEKARNHLQHMRGDLSSNDDIKYALLGSVAWASGQSSYSIFLSQPTPADAHSIVYDRQECCWVAQYQYTVKDATINLDTVLSEMRGAYDWIINTVQFSDPEFSKLKWGETHAFCFRVQQSTAAASQPILPPDATQ